MLALPEPKPTGSALSRIDSAELLQSVRRERCKRSLTRFSSTIDRKVADKYQAHHLRVIADKLQRLVRREFDRLFITTPPRHWKSSLVSEKFPLWFLSLFPDKSVGLFSHGNALPKRFSMNVRSNIESNQNYHELFPEIALKPGSSNQTDWSLTTAFRSSLRAFGVGSAPTGEGFDLIIIDDPVADAMEAYSPTALETIWTWYQETLRDRLNPGGIIVLVMSRWHENDPAGRLLRESAAGTGERWEELRLPAIAEANDILGRKEGEALWPGMWPLSELERTRKAQGARAFAARFQGSPRAIQGNLLDPKKLIMIDESQLPKRFKMIVRFWDLAFSDSQAADYSCGCKMALGFDGKVYILHIKHTKGKWPQTAPLIRSLARSDGPQCKVGIECNGTQLGYADDMKQDERMRGYVVLGVKPIGSKETRASVWGSRLDDNLDNAGNLNPVGGVIYCVRSDNWNGELFDEMDFFPAGQHDDIVDGVSGGWAMMFTPSEVLALNPIGKPEATPDPIELPDTVLLKDEDFGS